MKVLTLHQPWATFIALGVKTIETRAWGTDYRGPIAIHAGLTWPDMMRFPELKRDGTQAERDAFNHQTWFVCDTIVDPAYHGPQPCNPVTGRQRRIPKKAQAPTLFWPHAGPWYRQGKPMEHPYEGRTHHPHTEPLPLGQIIAVADLVDVLPMETWAIGSDCVVVGDDHLDVASYPTAEDIAEAEGNWWMSPPDPDVPLISDIADQRPFGDYRPGRHAWMLDNIRPLAAPIVHRGAQGLRDLPEAIEALIVTDHPV